MISSNESPLEYMDGITKYIPAHTREITATIMLPSPSAIDIKDSIFLFSFSCLYFATYLMFVPPSPRSRTIRDAESAAIASVPYAVGKDIDWSKVHVYVYRICNGKKHGYGNARPCPACMNAIKDMGIKNVYYTDEEGLGYLKLN